MKREFVYWVHEDFSLLIQISSPKLLSAPLKGQFTQITTLWITQSSEPVVMLYDAVALEEIYQVWKTTPMMS